MTAEIKALRAEVYRLQELCNGLHRSLTDSQAGFVHYRDRAERLAEALRFLRNNTPVNSNQIMVIDDALSTKSEKQDGS